MRVKITGIELIFENSQTFSVEPQNILEFKYDFQNMVNKSFPETFFSNEEICPNYISLKLAYHIGEQLLDRLQRYKDITFIKVNSELGSCYIQVPYSDIDKSNPFNYLWRRFRELFKETMFLGQNVYQKNRYTSDGVEITINKRRVK